MVALSDFDYGERLVYSSDGSCFVYINFLEDPVVREVEEILGKIGVEERDLTAFGQALLAASDGPRGKTLDFDRVGPACPRCGCSELATELRPWRTTRQSTPVLTHHAWKTLEPAQRERLIEEAVVGRSR